MNVGELTYEFWTSLMWGELSLGQIVCNSEKRYVVWQVSPQKFISDGSVLWADTIYSLVPKVFSH